MSEKVRASHILCKHRGSRNPISRRTDKHIDIDKSAAICEIQTIIDLVRSDPSKFAVIAHDRSDCGSFARGGDLGYFGHGEMQRPFEIATFTLKIGEISGVVETDSGIHVIIRTG